MSTPAALSETITPSTSSPPAEPREHARVTVLDGLTRREVMRHVVNSLTNGSDADVRASGSAGSTSSPNASAGSPDEASTSRQVDPFITYYRDGIALRPPVSYPVVTALYDASDALQSAIAAMAVNIAGFGFQLVPVREIPEESRAEAEAEKRRLETWFRFCSSMPWLALRLRTRTDMEIMGDGYWEVLRNRKGQVVGIEHARSFWMRKGMLDTQPVECTEPVRDPETGEWVNIPVMRRFRRFCQMVNGTLTWFKEFGDPRKIRTSDGKEDDTIPDGDPRLATEVLNFDIYAPDSPYGKPRWRGAVTDVLGRTAAGEINSDGFDNKAIPPKLILVQGTLLGKAMMDQIRENFASVRGRENYHAPLVIEAAPMDAGMDGGPQPRVKIDVVDMQQRDDALFMKYRADAGKNIARSFRLPGLFLGASDDYTRATAEAAQEVGEEQVFAPERALEDEIINRRLLPALGARWWEVKGSSAPLLSEDTLIKLLEVGIKAGALSPEQVARVIDPILAQDITRSEAWAKLPTVVIEALLKTGWTVDGAEGLVKPEKAQAVVGGAAGAVGGADGAPTDAPPSPETAPSVPAEGGDGASGQSDAGKAQDWQQSTAGDTSGRTMLRTLTRAERHTGVMLALVPPEGVAGALALAEGEPPEELHVTLAFFGARDTLTPEQLDRIRAVASFAALTRGPVDGTFNGVARFAGAEGDAVVLTLDAPGLETWREMLAGALRSAGVAPSAAHGFTPHMTVCYLAAGAATPMDRIEPAAVQFGALELWVAGEREKWPLAGA